MTHIEQKNDDGSLLSPSDATKYRALAARANVLAQDRADLAFTCKELCRHVAHPTTSSLAKLVHLVRYLVRCPRLAFLYPWQSMPTSMDAYADTDFAGCNITRRSTSGGCILIGKKLLKHDSSTQTTIALSSGEAELHGIAKCASHALGFQAMARDLHVPLQINLHSDAIAAIGIARRRGIGRIRHLDVTDLWIQEKIRTKEITLLKTAGVSNPADLFYKISLPGRP